MDSDEFYTTLVDIYASKSKGTRKERSASSTTSYTFIADEIDNGQQKYALCKSDETSNCICRFPYFSKPQLIPPLGNPNVNGITAGNIQDSGTPFKWTQ